MSGFQLVARVLAKLEPGLKEEFGDGLDSEIQNHLAYLQETYKVLHNGHNPPSYSHSVTQYCYAFKYVVSHSYFLRRLLEKSLLEKQSSLFSGEQLHVACLGGGPGSDLIGVLEYLKINGCNEPTKSVVFDVWDKEQGWEELHAVIASELNVQYDGSISFRKFDVSDAESWASSDFSKYDLITVNFFLSEVFRLNLGEPAGRFIGHVLASMSREAVIAFIDNDYSDVYEKFDHECERAEAMFMYLFKGEEQLICQDAYAPIAHLIDRIDHRPKLKGNLSLRLLYRESP